MKYYCTKCRAWCGRLDFFGNCSRCGGDSMLVRPVALWRWLGAAALLVAAAGFAGYLLGGT